MGTFFAKDKKSAVKRLKVIAMKEGVRFSSPKLAKKQIPHISKFKTFKAKRLSNK
tara:strand:- start:957 stop:1121 length:165 start_codon:yes stop_codon:yes gene_type:complete